MRIVMTLEEFLTCSTKFLDVIGVFYQDLGASDEVQQKHLSNVAKLTRVRSVFEEALLDGQDLEFDGENGIKVCFNHTYKTVSIVYSTGAAETGMEIAVRVVKIWRPVIKIVGKILPLLEGVKTAVSECVDETKALLK